MKLTLICVFMCIGISTVHAVYDCRRDSATLCEFGTCNPLSGACESCQSGYEGYDCSIVTADIDGPGCPDGRCRNGGTCHGGTCACTQDWTGNRCQYRRYDLNCNYGQQRMRMNVRPHVDNFVGKVYISNKVDESACNFQTAIGGIRKTLRLDHDDATCGPAVSEETERKRYVIVQFNPTMQKPYDEYIEYVCGVDGILEDLTFQITVGEITGALIPVTKSLSPLVGDIEMRITLTDSEDAVTAVDVNTHLHVYFVLTAQGDVKFDTIRLENCIASNLPAGTEGYTEAKFIYNSCPHPNLDNVMDPDVNNGGSDDAGFSFYAFKFLDSDDLYITCDVRTCEDTTGCEADACDGGKRKKRESGDEPKQVQGKIHVNDPASLAFSELKQAGQDAPVCYQTNEMKATLVALSVALGIALFICIVIVIVKIVGRNKSDD